MIYREIPIQVEGSAAYARLEAYILDTPCGGSVKFKKRPMILICPGGGYEFTSFREGEPTAVHFLNRGYHACVLRYSTAPHRFPTQVLEAGQAVKIIREHAEVWNVDMDRLVVQGASAGGHLAASYGVFWNQDFVSSSLGISAEELRPAGVMLSYPVITSDARYAHAGSFENLLGEELGESAAKVSIERLITETMPPCFIWHTMSDNSVPVENSLLLMWALRRAGVSSELHIFPEGEHGLSLATPVVEREDGSGVQAECAQWAGLADTWLERLFEKVRL